MSKKKGQRDDKTGVRSRGGGGRANYPPKKQTEIGQKIWPVFSSSMCGWVLATRVDGWTERAREMHGAGTGHHGPPRPEEDHFRFTSLSF